MNVTVPALAGVAAVVVSVLNAPSVAPPTAAVNVVAPVVLTVNDLAVKLAVLMVPPKLTLALPAATDTSSVNTQGAPPKVTAAFAVLIRPAALMLLGAVAVKPPAKLKASVASSPKVKLPVWLNTVLLVTVVCAPKSFTL